MSQDNKRNFILHGSILAMAGIFVRIIGMVYRIPVLNIIGSEGNGIYVTAYNVYNIILVLSSYGLPMAVSKLISARFTKRRYKNAAKVLRCSLTVGAFTGGVAALLVYFGADFIENVIYGGGVPGLAIPLRVLAPTIFIVALLGVLRGFFQGQGTMIPTAVSQIIEQLVNAGVSIAAAGNYDDITDAAIIVITAGANQKPDETRLDLIKKNAAIMKSIVGEIKKRDFGGILLIVSNPVDILTLIALKESGYPSNRVIGSGTVLDTGRFKYLLGEHLDVDSRSVHAFIIGEHGDSELAAWSNARIGGLKVNDFCELRGHFNHEQSMKKIFENVRNSAYEIIERKHATYYGIAMAVKRICEAIVRNEKSILPVSSLMTGEYGLNDVVLSCIFGLRFI